MSVEVGRGQRGLLKSTVLPILQSKPEAEQQTDAGVVFLNRGLKIDIVKVNDERRCEGQLGIHRIFRRDSNGNISARIVAIDPARTTAPVEIGMDQSEPCKRHHIQ